MANLPVVGQSDFDDFFSEVLRRLEVKNPHRIISRMDAPTTGKLPIRRILS